MVQDGLTVNPGATHPVNIQKSVPSSAPQSAQVKKSSVSPEEESLPVQKKIDPDVLTQIAEEINEDFRIFNTAISFSVDKNTGNTVIKILDRETDKVIREIPPGELLRLAAKLAEIIGRIVDEIA